MADREKVIEYLNSEIYRAEQSVNDIWLECVEVKLLRDALELLKEQEHKDKMFHALEDDWKRLKELLKEKEANCKEEECMLMEVIPVTIGNDYRTWFCSACRAKLQYKRDLICPKCHRRIDWEGR